MAAGVDTAGRCKIMRYSPHVFAITNSFQSARQTAIHHSNKHGLLLLAAAGFDDVSTVSLDELCFEG